MSAEAHEMIQAIHSAATPTRAAILTSRFHETYYELYRRWGRQLARKFHLPRESEDDIAQEIAILADRSLTEWDMAEVRNWEGFLYAACSARVRQLAESGQWAPMTGMSTHIRKERALHSKRQELQQALGREPEPQEVLAAHNDEYAAHRREGMIATSDDLERVRVNSLDALLVRPATLDVADTVVISASESPEFVRLVIDQAEQRSARLGLVARTWLVGFTDEADEYPEATRSVREVADMLGSTYEATRRSVTQIRQIAVLTLAGEYGITEEDWKAS